MIRLGSEDTWVWISTAARMLGKSLRTIRYYVDAGMLRARRTGPRGWQQISYEDIVRLRSKAAKK